MGHFNGKGPSPKEWREFLEWNLDTMIERNVRRGHQLQKYADRYRERVGSSVEAGRLHETFLDRTEQVVPTITRLYSDPLFRVLGLAALATPRLGVTVVDYDFDNPWQAIVHEETHHVGRLKTRFWREAVTDILSEVIVGPRDWRPEHSYGITSAVKHMLDRAGVTTQRLSQIYARNNASKGLAALTSELAPAYSAQQVRGIAAQYWQDAMASNLVSSSYGMDIADANVIVAVGASRTLEDALRTLHPEMPDEQVEGAFVEAAKLSTKTRIAAEFLRSLHQSAQRVSGKES